MRQFAFSYYFKLQCQVRSGIVFATSLVTLKGHKVILVKNKLMLYFTYRYINGLIPACVCVCSLNLDSELFICFGCKQNTCNRRSYRSSKRFTLPLSKTDTTAQSVCVVELTSRNKAKILLNRSRRSEKVSFSPCNKV